MIHTIDLKFTPNNGESAFSVLNKRTDNEIEIDGVKLLSYLTSVKYDKEIYSPCRIEADIVLLSRSLSNNNPILPSVTKLRDFFLGCNVEANLIQYHSEAVHEHETGLQTDQQTAAIGKNYQVINVVPRITRAGGKSVCYLHLIIYSKDYLLTLDKYCRTYTGQKLGEHIFKDKMTKTTGFGSELFSFNANQLMLLKYKPSDNDAWVEFRHPYLVQYNESFYDFLARNCNRCGEFLFFEDGKLTLGLPDGKPVEINPDNILSISYPTLLDTEKFVEGSYYNYMSDKVSTFRGDGEHAYDWDMAGDEYFEELDVNGPDDLMGCEYAWAPKLLALIDNMPRTMSCTRSWTEALGRYAVEVGIMLLKEQLAVTYCNNDFKDTVVAKASDRTDYYDDKEQKRDGKLYQFASLTPGTAKNVNDKCKNISAIFFKFVRGMQSDAAHSAIELELLVEPETARLRVGDRITLDNENYVIIRINGSFQQDTTQVSESLSILAIPYDDSNVIIPPAYKLADPPKASAQPAFVTDNADPQYLGRVRVKFPWQSSGETATPWIRMATPMASKDGGFFARPEKDDEVLVEFRNGDMQHPVVVGALYRGDRPTPHNTKYAYGGTATTKWQNNCGQQFILNNGKPKDFVLGFSPAASFCVGMMSAKWVNDGVDGWLKGYDSTKATLTKLSGGITLSDTYGLTSITTETAKRAITIKSALGNITISALTGITISAPKGNINIEGKNVSIKALNNISIESGLSIKNDWKRHEYDKKLSQLNKVAAFSGNLGSSMLAAILDKVSNPLDLSLLRSIWEAFSAPQEGTLLLKSNRYLQLEAGKGKTVDTSAGFLSYLKNDPMLELTVAIKQIAKRVTDEINTAVSTYHKIQKLISEYRNTCFTLAWVGVTVKYNETIPQLIKSMYEDDEYSTDFTYNNQTYHNAKEFTRNAHFDAENHAAIQNTILTHLGIHEEQLKRLSKLIYTLPLSKNPRLGGIYRSANKDFFKLDQSTCYIPASVRDNYRKALQALLKEAYKELHILPSENDFDISTKISKLTVETLRDRYIRRAHYKLLTSVNFVKSSIEDLPDEHDMINDDTWGDYLDSLELQPPTTSTLDAMGLGSTIDAYKKIFNVFYLNSEKNRWTAEQTGRIMVSDNSDTTMVLSEEGTWEPKQNGLAALKTILGGAPKLEDNEVHVIAEANEEEEDDND